ncbi:COQ9 family protein [Novosphingobium sp. TH158]|uniref:COQ9 family protein n=1 Tax=Novosphingobium sp. TH158 TaxID=2067455 RepID=UPI00156FDB77|nr:COQ9 family protein [Novosphingobium sp. TH158]
MTTDLTLSEMRAVLAPVVARAAAFDGWSAEAVTTAAEECGIDAQVAPLAFPGGAMDMIDAWTASVDAAMAHALPAQQIGNLPIRERIRRLVQFRLDHVAANRESLRRALSIMAMPQNLVRAAQLGWRSADAMWRLAGDTAVDYNHYTKRATLGGIYAATLTVFANDESEDFAETRAFLDRRIEGVMKFEKAKARLLANRDMHFSPARFLGRLRYPGR